jgi:molecular chaperone GrpE (heat shock protein)
LETEILTCYFRHLSSVFAEAGITVTPENRKDLDRVIHQLVSVDYKDCSKTWRQVKQRLTSDHEGFVLQLKNVWQHHV